MAWQQIQANTIIRGRSWLMAKNTVFIEYRLNISFVVNFVQNLERSRTIGIVAKRSGRRLNEQRQYCESPAGRTRVKSWKSQVTNRQ